MLGLGGLWFIHKYPLYEVNGIYSKCYPRERMEDTALSLYREEKTHTFCQLSYPPWYIVERSTDSTNPTIEKNMCPLF